MDPYLEDPALWPDVHSRLINISSEILMAQLRPKYFVQIDERLWVATEEDEARDVIVPDLRIRQVGRGMGGGSASGGVSAAVADVGVEILYEFEIEVHEARLRILDRDSQRVITVIEFLSPANKVRGSGGRESYEQKRKDVLSCEASFVEIDLLRTGERPPSPRNGIGPYDYLVQVWRWTGERHRIFAWPMLLEERLKVIPIPVRPEDPDGTLDLQSVLNTAYDRAGYDVRVNYGRHPAVLLPPEQARWADEHLKAGPR